MHNKGSQNFFFLMSARIARLMKKVEKIYANHRQNIITNPRRPYLKLLNTKKRITAEANTIE